MRSYLKIAAFLFLSAATLSASGWRIPENSLNSTALSAAYVAGANDADAAYFNPANMAFMEDGSSLETALTYINLPKINYVDTLNTAPYNGDSQIENFFIPTFHYVSPFVNNFRFGLSMVAPGGLSKRWDEAYGKSSAEEFTLSVVELNPSVSYKVNEKFAVGFGVRALYSEGIVKSNYADLNDVNASRDMEGDSIDFGYNLAVSYKATNKLTLASTYRSKVILTEKGTAKLSYAGDPAPEYSGGAEVEIPIPASLTLAANYDFGKTNVEFVFERTFWSAYKELDFKYDTPQPAFDAAITKNWKDADAYRLGVTHQYNEKLKLMGGFAIDKNGADKDHIGFELPESDAKLYSLGFEYKVNANMKVGLAYLYDQKDELTVLNRTTNEPNGTFTDASAHLVTVSMKYKF